MENNEIKKEEPVKEQPQNSKDAPEVNKDASKEPNKDGTNNQENNPEQAKETDEFGANKIIADLKESNERMTKEFIAIKSEIIKMKESIENFFANTTKQMNGVGLTPTPKARF